MRCPLHKGAKYPRKRTCAVHKAYALSAKADINSGYRYTSSCARARSSAARRGQARAPPIGTGRCYLAPQEIRPLSATKGVRSTLLAVVPARQRDGPITVEASRPRPRSRSTVIGGAREGNKCASKGRSRPFARSNAANHFCAFASASSFSSWLTRSCSANKRELNSPTLKNVTLLAGASRVLP